VKLALAAALLLAAAPAAGQEAGRKDEPPAARKKARKRPPAPRGRAAQEKASDDAKAAAAARAAAAKDAGRKPKKLISDLQPQATSARLEVRPVGVRPLDASGVVRHATRQRAWLDAGTRDGLAVGQSLVLLRRGQPSGTCTVETAAERNATCTGQGVRAGDTFAVKPAPGAVPAALPPRPSGEEQARRLSAVQLAIAAPVDFKGKPRSEVILERRRPYEAGVGHAAWLASDVRGIQEETVWAVVRDAETWKGARLNLDLTAVHRTEPPETTRVKAGHSAFVWLREASLTLAGPDRPWALTAGRVLPWRMPGGPTFDGVQAAWHPSRFAEVGLFGGAVPAALLGSPQLDLATGGAYWSAETTLGTRALLRSEGRVALLTLPGSRSRFEGEATAQAWVGKQLDVSAQARLGFGDYAAPGNVDAARVDVSWRRPGLLSVYGGWRYAQSMAPDATAPAFYPGKTRHADGAVTWERLGWLHVRLVGGDFRDVSTAIRRSWVGPELAAPRLLGRWGGLSLGYAEELGYLAGRHAWLQGDFLLPRTHLLARATFAMDSRPSPLVADSAAGLTLGAATDLASWLRLRLTALARYGIPLSEEAASRWGVSAFGGLEARY
jgi:hypothetical protein